MNDVVVAVDPSHNGDAAVAVAAVRGPGQSIEAVILDETFGDGSWSMLMWRRDFRVTEDPWDAWLDAPERANEADARQKWLDTLDSKALRLVTALVDGNTQLTLAEVRSTVEAVLS